MYDPKANPQDNVTVERDGYKFNILKRETEDGFFYLKTEFELPTQYQGDYTSIFEATKAINAYCEQAKEVVKTTQHLKAKKVA